MSDRLDDREHYPTAARSGGVSGAGRKSGEVGGKRKGMTNDDNTYPYKYERTAAIVSTIASGRE